MKKTRVDLTGCRYIQDMHQILKSALHFPDYYGENWDTFRDSITCDCNIDFVTVVGLNTVAEELKADVQTLLELLEENKQFRAKNGWTFDYVIEN